MPDSLAGDLKLVIIEWVDSSRGDGWVSVDTVDDEAHTVTSVGWVVKENDAIIVIAPHHSPETPDAKEQICGHMKIPKCAVVRTREINEPDA